MRTSLLILSSHGRNKPVLSSPLTPFPILNSVWLVRGYRKWIKRLAAYWTRKQLTRLKGTPSIWLTLTPRTSSSPFLRSGDTRRLLPPPGPKEDSDTGTDQETRKESTVSTELLWQGPVSYTVSFIRTSHTFSFLVTQTSLDCDRKGSDPPSESPVAP